jgi:hypothetical protein
VSAAPAAVLARIKVAFPDWVIIRGQPDGALTAHRYIGNDLVSICAPDPEALEIRLRDHEAHRAPGT